MVRHNNQLPVNLPQLQNLIKRDPDSYKDEFLQQYKHFLNMVEIFQYCPDEPNKSLDDLVMFIAQVAQCYIEELKNFPQKLMDLLRNHSTTLDPTMRNSFCRALILLRNKNLIPALDLLELFFQLLRCPDKNLRKFLENHIITDIKNMNAKQKDMKLNSALQNFMYSMLRDSNPKAAKMSVDIMIELYKKNVWNDAKTVNVIASVGCFSKIIKVLVASLKFFLGSDESEDNEDDSDNEPDLKSAVMANKVNKKTKKRKKQLEAVKKQFIKSKKKKSAASTFNFSAIHLIYNPQGMAEDLFKQLQSSNDRFEIKLFHLDVISRLIGIHELFLFSFYPYVTRFLNPHQRQVTRILQFAAQASHELVPGEIVEPILKTIVNNFVTERNSSDVMAIGLNAIREICSRCPLSMSEDLLRDLVMYKTYKQKSVMMAARSLITLYREQLPKLLNKRDRGRPTVATVERTTKEYGKVIPLDIVPGSEALLHKIEKKSLDVEIDSSDDNDEITDGEWVDVQLSDDCVGEDVDSNEDEDENTDDDGSSDDDNSNESFCNDDDNDKDSKKKSEKKDFKQEFNLEKEINDGGNINKYKEATQELALTRIFTDEDFKRIDMENLKKQVTGHRKRPLEIEKSEFVKLDDIEMIFKKRKNDKATRLESVKAGRVDRAKFGYKDGRLNIHCSKTNREKRKTKNFQMVRNKARSKIKKSFRDKQIALRNHLTKQKKMK